MPQCHNDCNRIGLLALPEWPSHHPLIQSEMATGKKSQTTGRDLWLLVLCIPQCRQRESDGRATG